nr:hypothetical protein [Muribaculum intestinale]
MSQSVNSNSFVDACYSHGLISVSLYEIQSRKEEHICYFSNAANALNYAFLLKKRYNRPIAKRAMSLILWEVKRTNAVSSRAKARMEAIAEESAKVEQPNVNKADDKVIINDVISEDANISQYRKMKKKHPDAIILMRVGDFYECFADDAELAADILGITLTKRKNGKGSIYLAGFPHHALDSYLPKLVRAGKRVAICEKAEK